MEELTKQFMEYLQKEMNSAEKETKDKMLEIATILASLYLNKYPTNKGYEFRFKGSLIDDIFSQFRKDIYYTFQRHTENAIKLSILKNEKLFGEKIGEIKTKGWLNEKIGKYTLKQRIFKYSNMFKMEMEGYIAMGIVNGENPASFILKVKKHLSNPYDVLNVRTKADWKARRLAIKYNSGTGTYTSAFTNFERLINNEVLRSGRVADHIIWKNSKRVKGVLISLNPAHPKVDMCDDLVGLYPKGYIFLGFHPRCYCIATPMLNGDMVKSIPTQTKNFMSNDKNLKLYSELSFYNDNKRFFE